MKEVIYKQGMYIIDMNYSVYKVVKTSTVTTTLDDLERRRGFDIGTKILLTSSRPLPIQLDVTFYMPAPIDSHCALVSIERGPGGFVCTFTSGYSEHQYTLDYVLKMFREEEKNPWYEK